MADISAEITAFQNAAYGEDVRSALVNLARKLNTEYGEYETLRNQLVYYFDEIFPPLVSDSEVTTDYPLAKGSVTYRGLTITVYNDTLVHIKGTATGNIRVKLTDELVATSSAVGLLDNLNLSPKSMLDIHIKCLFDNSILATSGDRSRIAIYVYNSDSDEYSEIIKKYASSSWTNMVDGYTRSLVNEQLAAFVLFVLSGETIDTWLQISVKYTNLEEFNKRVFEIFQKYPIRNLPKNARDARLDFLYQFATFVTSGNMDTSDGSFERNAINNRFVTPYPKTYSNEVYVYSIGTNLKWNYRIYPSTNLSPTDYNIPTPISAYTSFGINFNANNTNTYSLEDLEDKILSKIVIYELINSDENTTSDVVTRNSLFAHNYAASIRKITGTSYWPTIAHVSDSHNDADRFINAMKVVDFYKPDCVVHTGDVVLHNLQSDTYSYFFENLPDTPLLLSLGNHDTGEYNNIPTRHSKTNAELFDFWITPLNNKYDYSFNNLYYAYDVKNIRIICLNVYDFDEHDDTNFTDRAGLYYSQDQIDWLITELQDAATNNKSIVIAAHELDVFLPYENTFGPFNVSPQKASTTGVFINQTTSKKWSGNPICDLVEAYINADSITQTYIQASADIPSAPNITINTSFSKKGKFICWLAGHIHADEMGWLPGYSQLAIRLISTCLGVGSLHSSHHFHDVGRLAGTASEDCFNFYTFDTDNEQLTIIRFGATKRFDLHLMDVYRTTYNYQTWLSEQSE